MTLIVLPYQGFAWVPDTPSPDTPAEQLEHGKTIVSQAITAAEEWLVDNAFPPYDLAAMDVHDRCVIGYWVDGVGPVGMEYPGAEMVVYVNIPPPFSTPDVPPSPPDPVPVDPESLLAPGE